MSARPFREPGPDRGRGTWRKALAGVRDRQGRIDHGCGCGDLDTSENIDIILTIFPGLN